MNVWQPIIFFEGEDEEELKSLFIQASARHYNNDKIDAQQITGHIFRDLKEPYIRSLQAAEYWSKDIAVQEAILNLVSYNGETDATKKRVQLLMSIAESKGASHKDRIAAIRVAAELEGEIKKSVEKKVTYGENGLKPAGHFLFKIDSTAGDKPEEIDENDE